MANKPDKKYEPTLKVPSGSTVKKVFDPETIAQNIDWDAWKRTIHTQASRFRTKPVMFASAAVATFSLGYALGRRRRLKKTHSTTAAPHSTTEAP